MQNFWEFFAGLGIFLYAMYILEDALKHLAGRTFKLFLKKHTDNKLNAILSGALVTGVLQSSSVVKFMTLAFVGAGVISMRNALAVVIGSNFGTTLDSWVVATLGFKFSIESFSLPIIAVSGITMALFTERKNVFNFSKFLFGFGLLFLGLSFMKESIELFVKGFDFSPYLEYNKIVFVVIGFIITALIQSSSATMVIVLSALNTGVIPFETAASVVIGSELGTSLKILIGSIGGIPAKKRVALGNILFNSAITLFGFFFLDILIDLIRNVMGINEPLIALVLFQSTINLAGVILFFPFMDSFSGFLGKRYTKETDSATLFICNVSPSVSEAALDAMEKEVLLFIHRVLRLNLESFHIEEGIISADREIKSNIEKKDKTLRSYNAKYEDIKHTEGEILSFYFRVQEEKVEKEDNKRLDQLMASVRNAMYSAKSMKDIHHNRKDFRNSGDDVKYDHYKFFQSQLISFYTDLNGVLKLRDKSVCFGELLNLLEITQKNYDARMHRIYQQAGKNSLQQTEISTLLNVNREIYSSCKAITFSLKDFILDFKAAEDFNNVPAARAR